MKYSILIPAYNVETYVAVCIDSVLSQSFKDFEIVIIDDCSNDSTYDICKKYQGDKVRVYRHEENKGILTTRRDLFRLARGEWVISVDADDEVSPKMLEEIEKVSDLHSCDMVLYNYTKITTDVEESTYNLDLIPNIQYSDTMKREIYSHIVNGDRLNSMCTKAIRREILDLDVDYSKWRFIETGDDLFMVLPLLDRAKTIIYINKDLYIYRKREGSITTKKIKPNLIKQFEALWEREDYYFQKWGISYDLLENTNIKRLNTLISLSIIYANYPDYNKKEHKEENAYFDKVYNKAQKNKMRLESIVFGYLLYKRKDGLFKLLVRMRSLCIYIKNRANIKRTL